MEISPEVLGGVLVFGSGIGLGFNKIRSSFQKNNWNGEERRDYVSVGVCNERHKTIEKSLDEGKEVMTTLNSSLQSIDKKLAVLVATHEKQEG